MKNNDKLLKIISNEALDAFDNMSIVTPSMYTTFFNEKAKLYNLDITDEAILSQELISKECENLLKIRDKNEQNTNLLSDSTSKAINAIKEKDENSLNEILKETEALRREIEALKTTIYKDELTSVYNRKWLKDNYFEKDSNEFINGGFLAVIDLDSFKEVNDNFGHTVGDKVLIFIANNLKKTKANVVRYGGDEFLIIFEKNSSIDDVISKMNSIQEDTISKKLKSKNGEFKVSFSIGISEFNHGDNFTSVFENADKRMYADKAKKKSNLPLS